MKIRGIHTAIRLAVALCVIAPDETMASSPNPHEICDAAAALAAGETGVPLSVLMAVARTESGTSVSGRLTPWPWTVNSEGRGLWFDTEKEAVHFIRRTLDAGKTSTDVGCFQLNIHWHGAQFQDIRDMIDPVKNARYAATFLSELYEEAGDWLTAVGRFHSRTKQHAKKYLTRFARIHREMRAEPGNTQNQFPLLKFAGGHSSPGSLVSLNSVQRPALFQRSPRTILE